MLHYHKKLHWQVGYPANQDVYYPEIIACPSSFSPLQRSYEHIPSRVYEHSLSLPMQLLMVPRERLELSILAAVASKTTVYTIPPPGQIISISIDNASLRLKGTYHLC